MNDFHRSEFLSSTILPPSKDKCIGWFTQWVNDSEDEIIEIFNYNNEKIFRLPPNSWGMITLISNKDNEKQNWNIIKLGILKEPKNFNMLAE